MGATPLAGGLTAQMPGVTFGEVFDLTALSPLVAIELPLNDTRVMTIVASPQRHLS